MGIELAPDALDAMDVALSVAYSALLLGFLIGSYWWLARARIRK